MSSSPVGNVWRGVPKGCWVPCRVLWVNCSRGGPDVWGDGLEDPLEVFMVKPNRDASAHGGWWLRSEQQGRAILSQYQNWAFEESSQRQ